MKVFRIDNEGLNSAHYTTDITDIRKIAEEFGRTEDSLKLYDDNDNLVAIAAWPIGSAVYHYCTNPQANPVFDIYRL